MNQADQDGQDENAKTSSGRHAMVPRPARKRQANGRFGLTWSNILLATALSIAAAGLFIFNWEKTGASFGELVVKVIFLFIGPTIFAFVFSLFFNNRTLSSVSFNLVAILSFLGFVVPNQLLRDLLERSHILAASEQKKAQLEVGKELAENKEQLKKDLNATDDPAEASKAIESYASKTHDLLGKYAKASTGPEKKALEIARDFSIENDRLTKTWRKAMDAYQAPRILDYSRLNTTEEFQFQKKVVQNYIAEGEGFLKRSQGMISDLTRRLEVLGPNDPQAKKAIATVTRKFERQRPFFIPMMKSHISLGKASLELLDLLEKNQTKWAVKNGDLEIEDDDLLKKANTILDTMRNNEETINKSFDELIKIS